jgi:hypothetical protein
MILIYKDYADLFGSRGNKARFKESILFKLISGRCDEQTIVYCASPSKARRLSREFANFIQKINLES